jgi:hypothetical protein
MVDGACIDDDEPGVVEGCGDEAGGVGDVVERESMGWVLHRRCA